MRIPESELIINDDGSAFHIHLRPEELADIVILVGDPGRVEMSGNTLPTSNSAILPGNSSPPQENTTASA
jgi:uridine phosphorylase